MNYPKTWKKIRQGGRDDMDDGSEAWENIGDYGDVMGYIINKIINSGRCTTNNMVNAMGVFNGDEYDD